MSATIAVPAAVPSVTHSSLPCIPSLAVNSDRPVAQRGETDADQSTPDPGLMSATSAVPAAVPSVTHSSEPCVPSSAANSSLPVAERRETV